MDPVTVGCLQMEVVKGDPAANLGALEEALPGAASGGVRILVLPELWLCGFAYRELPAVAAGLPDVLRRLSGLAAAHRVALAGSLPEAHRGRLYNTLFTVDVDGTPRARYRKIHLFPGFRENDFLSPGTEAVNTELAGLPVGLAVCFDLRFPELFRKLALRGARLMLVSAEWPLERLDHWRLLARARAVENQVFVAAVNAAGSHGATVFAGHSLVVGPGGDVLAEGGEEPGLVSAAVDPSEVDRARAGMDCLACRVKGPDSFLTLD